MAYPTFDQKVTITRLRESLETVLWAAKLVPADYTHALLPGSPTDAWTVTMNIAHLIVYDEGIAIPVLESLAEGENGTTKIQTENEAWFYNDAVLLAAEPLDALLERFVSARMHQANVAGSFTDSEWNRRWSPVFGSGAHGNGPHSPAWVANKTFQHTWEHGNAVLRAALMDESSGNVIGIRVRIRVRGKMTPADYRGEWVTRLDELLRDGGKVRILVLMEEFERFTSGAFFEDLKYGFDNLKSIVKGQFEKMAIVGGSGVLRQAGEVFGYLIPGEVKAFEASQSGDAWTWVRA